MSEPLEWRARTHTHSVAHGIIKGRVPPFCERAETLAGPSRLSGCFVGQYRGGRAALCVVYADGAFLTRTEGLVVGVKQG
jgi:hypothetical protein